jgi:hypothetical protein
MLGRHQEERKEIVKKYCGRREKIEGFASIDPYKT